MRSVQIHRGYSVGRPTERTGPRVAECGSMCSYGESDQCLVGDCAGSAVFFRKSVFGLRQRREQASVLLPAVQQQEVNRREMVERLRLQRLHDNNQRIIYTAVMGFCRGGSSARTGRDDSGMQCVCVCVFRV